MDFIKCFQIVLTLERGRRGEGRGGTMRGGEKLKGEAERRRRGEEGKHTAHRYRGC